THTGAVLGTPSYMAPEQRMGRRDVGFACDIWALGITIRELVTGSRPSDTAAKADQTPPESVPAAPAAASNIADPGLAAIVNRCLQSEPANRYPSAGALADDLEQWLRGEYVPPPPKLSRS